MELILLRFGKLCRTGVSYPAANRKRPCIIEAHQARSLAKTMSATASDRAYRGELSFAAATNSRRLRSAYQPAGAEIHITANEARGPHGVIRTLPSSPRYNATESPDSL